MMDEISRYLLVIIICLLIFMLGIQVGKRLRPAPPVQLHTVEAGEPETTIQITIL